MFKNNFIALVLTLLIALVWLRMNDLFAEKGWISSSISRKIIHIGTGPIFVLCWLFFNDAEISPFLAALVPLGITIQFFLVGTGILKDPAAVEAMSRSGDRREILRGPLYYDIVFILLTIIYWRNSPIGIIALMILCGGDGLADIAGKLIGGVNIPWAQKKTLAGSLTMFFVGLILSTLVVWVFISHNYFQAPITDYILPIGFISLASTITESLPFNDIDNITVPLVSVILGLFLF